jgi:hypothetical protein
MIIGTRDGRSCGVVCTVAAAAFFTSAALTSAALFL